MASTLMVVFSVPASIPACGSKAGSSGGAVFAAAKALGNGRGSYVWPRAIDALNRPTLSAITEALSIRTPVGIVTEYNHRGELLDSHCLAVQVQASTKVW